MAPPTAAPPRLFADAWAWLTLLAILPLAQRMAGAPWGEPVAEDFDFLHRALLQGMGSLLDGGGSSAFWRPIPHQLYYAALGPLLVTNPALVTVLHLGLLALGALLLYRTLRLTWTGPLACMAAAFTLGAESTRTIASWPTQFVDLGLFVASALAVHEAARRRWLGALAALAAALLCKEVAIVTGLLLPFVPGAARDRRERLRAALGSAGVLAVWGAATLAIRQRAHLELPQRIAGSAEALSATFADKLQWAFAGSLKALASLPIVPSPDDVPVAIAAPLILLLALVLLVMRAQARERFAPILPWCVWGAAWFVLATATLAPIFPSWQPNRSHYASAGFGVSAIALTGAAHPALALAVTVLRLATLERAPGPTSFVLQEAPETGAFMDYARLTRLQTFMRAARTRLQQRWPHLPAGSVVVQQNLPHGIEYAFGGPHALQVWYRDATLAWLRFDVFRAALDTPVWTILQGEGGHEPPVALVEPDAIRAMFAAQPLVYGERFAELLPLLDHADSLQTDRAAVSYRVLSGGMRGYAYLKTGRAAEAEKLLQPLVEIAPEDLTARQVLAQALGEQGHWDEAFAHLDVLRRLDASNAATLELGVRLEARRRAVGDAVRLRPAVPPASR